MTQIFGAPARVVGIGDVFPEDGGVVLELVLDNGDKVDAWVGDDVRSRPDAQLVTQYAWDEDAWNLADDVLAPLRPVREEDPPPSRAVDDYFGLTAQGNRGAFIPEVLAVDVEWGTRLVVGPDRRLWRYVAGVYYPDGEEYVRGRATSLLRGAYRSEHVQQVVKHFFDRTAHDTLEVTARSDELCVANGVIELGDGNVPRRGRLPAFSDGAMVQLPVRYDPEATCPAVDKFLQEVLPADCVKFAYQLIGYMMVPTNPLRKAVLLLGPTGTGKSTFLHLLLRFLGERNCCALALRDTADNRFAPAQLFGKLANLCGDIGARAPDTAEMFKKITGGDPIQAEHKGKDSFVFTPFAKLVFSANEPPRTGDYTDAYFERWWVIPFEWQVPPERVNPRLARELTAPEELSGLLNRALAGLRELRLGVTVPDSVRAAVGRYRAEVDNVIEFVNDALEVDTGASSSRTAVYMAYAAWCAANGYAQPVRPSAFYRRVCELTGAKDRARRLVGVKLAA